MKLNKWTVGLAAVGAVSLASVAKADEKSSSLTSVSSTVLSGYVDTSMQWNLGEGDSHAPGYKYGGANKADGFNLDVVDLTFEKPLDESEWSSGYKAELWLGPDGNTLGTSSTLTTFGTSSAQTKSDFAIKQAYVALRAPVGNGLDFKVGVFDSVVGYESSDSINNPNYTRSWAHSFEPAENTGILATYRVNNMIAFSAGIADIESSQINGRAQELALNKTSTVVNESYKAYLASVALTAPDDWGFLAGSSLYAGFVSGWDAGLGANGNPQQNYYVGATINTPVTGLKTGVSFDYLRSEDTLASGALPAGGGFNTVGAHAWSLYASYQATEKLSFHGRAEYFDISPYAASALQTATGGSQGLNGQLGGVASSMMSWTGTVQYDLWKNVLSRVELRWDHALDGSDAFGGTGPQANQSGHIVTGTLNNSFIFAANIIYKF